jgi:hypothetical protein
VLRLRDKTRKRDKLIHSFTTYNKTNHKLVSSPLKTLWVLGQATGNTDSLDSPRLGLGGSHHLPHIVFFVLLHGTRIQMAFIPGTLKEESQNCLGLDPQDFGSSQLPTQTSDWDEV